MSMPTSPTRLFVCDGCGARLPVEPEHAGQKCRCGRCGKILVVPHDSADDLQTDQEVSPEPTPKYIGFSCRLCETRLSARPADVGRKAKCPDCGVLTVVPPPPKPRPKQIPRAMHGQQYGLWDVDTAPLPQEMNARQAKYFPVWCHVCDTLMHAEAKQVGKKLTCPDCGAKTVVLPPPIEKAKGPLLVPDGEEYQLDDAEPLPIRPTYLPIKVRELNEFEKREEQLRQEYYERPKLPRVPLVEGVHRMLVRRPLPEAVFALGVLLGLEIWFIANAMINANGLALAIVLLAYAVTALFGMVCLMAASAYWLAVLRESSEGSDRLYDPPGPVFLDWAGECFYVVFAGAMSVAPGLLLWKFVPTLPLWAGPVATAVCWLILFPVFLLSQLDNGSPLEFFSPRLASTLLKRPGQWILFYAETILFIGGSAATIVSLQLLSEWLITISVLLAAAVSFLYFRLLGRLAWWLAESLPLADDDE